MSKPHSGSCLCGQVRFEVEGDFDRFFLCHCQRCRKDTGSAHAANLFSALATVNWLSGQDNITRYNLPGTRHTRCFCSTCGSALPYPRASGGLVVPAGSLESHVPTSPTAHIFVASRANWDKALELVPSFDGFPS